MDGRGTTLERWGQKLWPLLVAPAVLVLFAAGIYAVGDAVLASAPAPDHPGFVDTVLGSRAVVAAIRLAVISAGVFVVVSVVALIARGQWLTRVGPVHVSERVATANADSRRVGEELAHVAEDDDDLRQKIAILDKRLASLSRTRKG